MLSRACCGHGLSKCAQWFWSTASFLCLQVAFYATSAAEFVEIVCGVGAARVRDLFRRANAYSDPAVVFIDEIDAIGVKRVASNMDADEEREQARPSLSFIF